MEPRGAQFTLLRFELEVVEPPANSLPITITRFTQFFWNNISPNGGGEPHGELREAIEKNFGSVDQFIEQWKAAAAPGAAFGSGWVWLVRKNDNSLAIEFHINAENPTSKGTGKEIVGEDVWEHAMYLDYGPRRNEFTATFLNLINWDYCNKRFIDQA